MSVYHSKPAEEDVSHQKISSHFLGPRAENYEFFRSNILTILEEHRDSRLDYFPDDGVSVPMFCTFAQFSMYVYIIANTACDTATGIHLQGSTEITNLPTLCEEALQCCSESSRSTGQALDPFLVSSLSRTYVYKIENVMTFIF